MKGYYKNQEETNKVMININGKEFFRTGDIGYLDNFDRLFINGRIKEQYKLENGKFVVPTLLEDIIILSPDIKQIMIYGENRPYNIALIVPNYDVLPEEIKNNKIKIIHYYKKEIISLLKIKNIKNYEIPKDVILIEELNVDSGLLTPKMSIKRNKVVEKYIDLINETYLNKLNTMG